MFLVDDDRNKHFGASKDVFLAPKCCVWFAPLCWPMLYLVCTLVLTVLNVAQWVRRSEENFLLAVNSVDGPRARLLLLLLGVLVNCKIHIYYVLIDSPIIFCHANTREKINK
jgi:hypothetical protein